MEAGYFLTKKIFKNKFGEGAIFFTHKFGYPLFDNKDILEKIWGGSIFYKPLFG